MSGFGEFITRLFGGLNKKLGGSERKRWAPVLCGEDAFDLDVRLTQP